MVGSMSSKIFIVSEFEKELEMSKSIRSKFEEEREDDNNNDDDNDDDDEDDDADDDDDDDNKDDQEEREDIIELGEFELVSESMSKLDGHCIQVKIKFNWTDYALEAEFYEFLSRPVYFWHLDKKLFLETLV